MSDKKKIQDLAFKLHFAEMLIEDFMDAAEKIPAEIYADAQTLLNSGTETPNIGFVVRPCGKKEPKIVIDQLQDIRASLDGAHFELIEENDYWFVYADEDGLNRGLYKNYTATALCERARLQGIILVGPILFLFKNWFDKKGK